MIFSFQKWSDLVKGKWQTYHFRLTIVLLTVFVFLFCFKWGMPLLDRVFKRNRKNDIVLFFSNRICFDSLQHAMNHKLQDYFNNKRLKQIRKHFLWFINAYISVTTFSIAVLTVTTLRGTQSDDIKRLKRKRNLKKIITFNHLNVLLAIGMEHPPRSVPCPMAT